MGVREQVIDEGIRRDAMFVGRFTTDMVNLDQRSQARGIIPLGIVPYFSLFVHESYDKLPSDSPLRSSLPSDVKAIVERSRHTLKLFEDTKRGVLGQAAYFRNDLLPAHHRRFFPDSRFDFLRRLRTDLGLFSYGSRLIATTHSAGFHLGIEPEQLMQEGFGPELVAIYAEYGSYFGKLGAKLGAGGTFLSQLDPKLFNQRDEDVRAERYYPRIFNEAATPEFNALLSVFQCMMNFADVVLTAGHTMPVTEYTVWKMRYLALYEVLKSLEVLQDEQSVELTDASVEYIGRITGTPKAQLILRSEAKPFRNALMHYDVRNPKAVAAIDLDEPLFGLVPVYFPHTTATFTKLVDSSISATASLLNEWAGT